MCVWERGRGRERERERERERLIRWVEKWRTLSATDCLPPREIYSSVYIYIYIWTITKPTRGQDVISFLGYCLLVFLSRKVHEVTVYQEESRQE